MRLSTVSFDARALLWSDELWALVNYFGLTSSTEKVNVFNLAAYQVDLKQWLNDKYIYQKTCPSISKELI